MVERPDNLQEAYRGMEEIEAEFSRTFKDIRNLRGTLINERNIDLKTFADLKTNKIKLGSLNRDIDFADKRIKELRNEIQGIKDHMKHSAKNDFTFCDTPLEMTKEAAPKPRGGAAAEKASAKSKYVDHAAQRLELIAGLEKLYGSILAYESAKLLRDVNDVDLSKARDFMTAISQTQIKVL
nr:hypothetical protein [Tanacetum cinerariifolium]